MFSSIKIGLILVMLAGAGGGYLYVTKLQKDNAILKENAIKLETAVEDQKGVIEQQTKDLKKIRSTLEEIEKVNARLQADRDSLNKRLGKHDIGNLAENNAFKLHLIESVPYFRFLMMGVGLLLIMRYKPKGILPEKIIKQ